MTVRTAICVLVMTTATAFGQDPVAIISNTRYKVRSGTDAVDQRRNDAMAQASAGARVQQPNKQTPRPAAAKTTGFAASSAKHSKATQVPQQPISAGKQVETAAPEMKKTVTGRGKRDPFVSVIRTQTAGAPVCPSGKKCLVVGKIELKGIVRSANGMIAVVENPERKTYFLHENDPVFDGQVVKIEPDGIVFRERVVDRTGRQSTREVIKRLSKPAV